MATSAFSLGQHSRESDDWGCWGALCCADERHFSTYVTPSSCCLKQFALSAAPACLTCKQVTSVQGSTAASWPKCCRQRKEQAQGSGDKSKRLFDKGQDISPSVFRLRLVPIPISSSFPPFPPSLCHTLNIESTSAESRQDTTSAPDDYPSITLSPSIQRVIAIMPSEAQIIGGHKANLHNPNTSAEAKEHSKEVLKEDFNGKNRHLQILHTLPRVSRYANISFHSHRGRQQDQGPQSRRGWPEGVRLRPSTDPS